MKRYDFHARLDGIVQTPQGGIRAKARVTRTGIFQYPTDDGGWLYELRPPEEVFKADSLETIKGCPIVLGHPSEVTTRNWRQLVVGHVQDDVRQDGIFVAATVVIQDAETCEKILDGELSEVSMGYDVDLCPTSGEYEGERYDVIQRNPRYNHCGLGGTSWGRAGTDVRIYTDSKYSDESPVERARREMESRHLNAWRR